MKLINVMLEKCILGNLKEFTMSNAFELHTKAIDKRESGRNSPGNTERGKIQHGWTFQNRKM